LGGSINDGATRIFGGTVDVNREQLVADMAQVRVDS